MKTKINKTRTKPHFIKEPFGLPRELQPTGKFRREELNEKYEELQKDDVSLDDLGEWDKEREQLIDTKQYKFGSGEWQEAMENNIALKRRDKIALDPSEKTFLTIQNAR